VPLDDAQIERYSRQLVLAEIGPKGQAILAAAHVGVAVAGAAAERVVAYLAAAGVGRLTVPPPLRSVIDPAQPDVAVAEWPPARGARFDALLAGAEAHPAGASAPSIGRTFWIARGRIGELPPCAACAEAALGAPDAVPPLLAPLQDAVLQIGAGLRGHALAYDPASATFTRTPVDTRPGCPCAAAR